MEIIEGKNLKDTWEIINREENIDTILHFTSLFMETPPGDGVKKILDNPTPLEAYKFILSDQRSAAVFAIYLLSQLTLLTHHSKELHPEYNIIITLN
jgi:hypothetical protein